MSQRCDFCETWGRARQGRLYELISPAEARCFMVSPTPTCLPPATRQVGKCQHSTSPSHRVTRPPAQQVCDTVIPSPFKAWQAPFCPFSDRSSTKIRVGVSRRSLIPTERHSTPMTHVAEIWAMRDLGIVRSGIFQPMQQYESELMN